MYPKQQRTSSTYINFTTFIRKKDKQVLTAYLLYFKKKKTTSSTLHQLFHLSLYSFRRNFPFLSLTTTTTCFFLMIPEPTINFIICTTPKTVCNPLRPTLAHLSLSHSDWQNSHFCLYKYIPYKICK